MPDLGVIPLEQMDLKVNLVEQKLEGAHGNEWVRQVDVLPLTAVKNRIIV
jgi:hypothetical protein